MYKYLEKIDMTKEQVEKKFCSFYHHSVKSGISLDLKQVTSLF